MSTPRRLAFVSLVLLAAAAGTSAAGCASAKRAYTHGMDYEAAGDYARAADAYATALERDPESRDPALRNVPGRLAVAGREAVRGWVTVADRSEPTEAAHGYLAAQALIQRTARLGIDLARIPSFDADLVRALDAAVVASIDRADSFRQSGDFSGSLAALARAQGFRPSPIQRRQVEEIRLATFTDWADADLRAGAYRSGLGHADAALAMAPSDEDLLNLRDAILDAGTVVAAVLPAEGDPDDDAFLRDLDDVMVEEGLTPSPLFIALIDPADVRRWDRRQRDPRDRRSPLLSDSPRRLAEAADDLGADLGVVVRMRRIQESTADGAERMETVARRRGSARDTIRTREVRLTLTASASVTAAHAGSGRTVCERSAEAQADVVYDRATTGADWRALDLSRRQRDAFADDVRDRAYDRALPELRDRLATALAREVAGCLSAQVP